MCNYKTKSNFTRKCSDVMWVSLFDLCVHWFCFSVLFVSLWCLSSSLGGHCPFCLFGFFFSLCPVFHLSVLFCCSSLLLVFLFLHLTLTALNLNFKRVLIRQRPSKFSLKVCVTLSKHCSSHPVFSHPGRLESTQEKGKGLNICVWIFKRYLRDVSYVS